MYDLEAAGVIAIVVCNHLCTRCIRERYYKNGENDTKLVTNFPMHQNKKQKKKEERSERLFMSHNMKFNISLKSF